jgi:NAD(P)-dependent dehydrogenase (short-subunit alcohol dehydrogenase family)
VKRVVQMFLDLVVASFLFLFLFGAVSAAAEAPDDGFVSRTSKVEGVELHYLTGGQGPAVILLHGYAETSRMWPKPRDIARVILFLCGDDARVIHGAAIPVYGNQ